MEATKTTRERKNYGKPERGKAIPRRGLIVAETTGTNIGGIIVDVFKGPDGTVLMVEDFRGGVCACQIYDLILPKAGSKLDILADTFAEVIASAGNDPLTFLREGIALATGCPETSDLERIIWLKCLRENEKWEEGRNDRLEAEIAAAK